MCLIAFALNQNKDFPFVLVANRDEFFERETTSLHQWPEGIIAGKDDVAGGTWLGVTKEGRWAALTNFRSGKPEVGTISRGQLITDYLTHAQTPTEYAHHIKTKNSQYAGFNMLFGDLGNRSAFFYSNREGQLRNLTAGFHALSNGYFSDPWPKMRHLEQSLQDLLNDKQLSTEAFFTLLRQPEKFSANDLPKTGVSDFIEKQLSSLFIEPFSIDGRIYGTRSSAILLMDAYGKLFFHERQFTANGNVETETEINFRLSQTQGLD